MRSVEMPELWRQDARHNHVTEPRERVDPVLLLRRGDERDAKVRCLFAQGKRLDAPERVLLSLAPQARATQAHPHRLTPRECKMLELICERQTNAQIARTLVISAKTVDHHISAVLAKLGVENREAARRQWGVIDAIGAVDPSGNNFDLLRQGDLERIQEMEVARPVGRSAASATASASSAAPPPPSSKRPSLQAGCLFARSARLASGASGKPSRLRSPFRPL
jgi:DNA-binding CsgD family transcriptional regulator